MSSVFAHTLEGQSPESWECLEIHLAKVAAMAAEFASKFGAEAWGEVAGRWHDIGKYSKEFQAYLKHETGFDLHAAEYTGRVDHSTAGAQHADREISKGGRLLAYCIAGHHTGLADAVRKTGQSGLDQRLRKNVCEYSDVPDHIVEAPKLPKPRISFDASDPQRAAFQVALFTRMLFSCLVDADFLATERFMARDKAGRRPGGKVNLQEMQQALNVHMSLRVSGNESVINKARAGVLEACRATALKAPGLYSLTVPTGGGKTLSSLAFALDHSVHHGMSRVIYAIPFTSIIEQTADVFRNVMRELPQESVLEHHNRIDPTNETFTARLAAQNWDAPLVVTTNVQLFESLFAARTSRCRKLHRICNSVIILDEAQTIPVELLKPTLAIIRELVTDYGCTVVLCTATQPVIAKADDFPIGLENVTEIIPEPAKLYYSMKRVTVRNIGRQTNESVVARLSEHRQFLCIVNTRPHAAQLFEDLTLLTCGKGEATTLETDPHQVLASNDIFHLSTFMCGQHRADTLTTIRKRLKKELPCRVISTQLIEAGVDVDFPVVYRAISGIDSIAQAAGRCNREGRRHSGDVFVFEPTDVRLRGYLKSVADSAGELIADHADSDLDLLNLEVVQAYFRLHYHKYRGGETATTNGWDKRDVLACFPAPMKELHFNFRTCAERFRWIEDQSETVFVPYRGSNGNDEDAIDLIERLRRDGPSQDLLRHLQRYSVGLFPNVFNEMVGSDIELLESGYSVLINESCYDPQLGFQVDRAGYHEPESLIM